MKTHGYIWRDLLLGTMFGTFLVLCISLPISPTNDSTLGKRKVKIESDWKKYYGSCPELKDDIKKYGKENFSREILSLHKTKGTCNYEETKQLFLNNVLSESLDNGAPAYYNSNILGRYMRKDYGNFRGHSAEST